MSMPSCPFVVGETYYRAMHQPERVRVPCPVCNGNQSVEIILGTGEHMIVSCEACGLGFERSRGYIEEYQYAPRAVPFTVGSIDGYSFDEWELSSQLGEKTSGSYLYRNEADALAESQRQSDEQQRENARSYSQTKKSAKKMTWSIRYHRECIKDLEMKIAYHVGEISAKEARP